MNSFKSIYQNRYVLQELVRKKVKTQYRNSALGMLWTILNPLLNMLVLLLIFSQFFGKEDPATYAVYLLTGTSLFACLRSATDGALGSIVNNRGLLTRVKIDAYLFPFSSVLSSLVTFAFSFLSLLIIMLGIQLFGGSNLFSFRIFAVFLMLPAFVLFELGIGLFLSAIYVFARDIKYLYSVFLTLWTYATPIFYKVSMFEANSVAATVVKLNPMYYFLTFFRESIYMGFSGNQWKVLAVLYGLGIVSLFIGTIVFKKMKKHFMKNI